MSTFTIITTYAVIGQVFVWLLIAAGWALTWVAGKGLWQRLRRIYHFTVIIYWLERLEKGGWRTFQKAEIEDRATQQGEQK